MKIDGAWFVCLALVASGAGCSKDDDSASPASGTGGGVGDTDCSRIAGACHGGGPETEECHELGHANVEADCSAALTECLALCQSTGGAGGESGEHHHEHPSNGGSGGADEHVHNHGASGQSGASTL
jgi:hypothetical protein